MLLENSELLAQIPAGISLILNAFLAVELKRKSVIHTEFSLLEKRCEAQRNEILNLHQKIGKLEEQTNLAPIIEALKDHNRESNTRFDKALEIQSLQSQQLIANTRAIENNTEAMTSLMLELFPGHSQRRQHGKT